MKNKLFNPDGSDLIEDRKIIGGNSTNLFNLNNVKYNWANKLYRVMMENFWIPEKVSLVDDAVDYQKMMEAEQKAYNGILSFLVFLDSIQTNNLANVSDYITAPEVKLALSVQTNQEAVHSQSYAYIIETAIPKDRRNEIYEFWRKDSVLFKRNKYIANTYQNFIDESNNDKFAEALIADYLLEGLYFYNGFNFFYNLASRNLMSGTKDIIKYIHKDELTHMVLFENIIKTVKLENKGLIKSDLVYHMFEEAVKHEIEWGQHIIGDDIMGMPQASLRDHTYWLANQRLKKLKMKEIFPKIEINPFQHLAKIADIRAEASSKGNFFETVVTSYNQSSVLKGWDDF